MQQLCRSCSVPLEGARELDEGRGDICMWCAMGELSIRIRHIETFLVLDMRYELPSAEDPTHA